MELFDILIFGAVFYYIARAVRRAASSQKDKRPPGSIASEDGQKLTWAERTQRALEGAMEWEEEQTRQEDEADVRAEIEAMRAAERQAASPWRHTRDEQMRALEEAEREVRHVRLPVSTIDPGLDSQPAGSAASALSNALSGVAAMLDQRIASNEEVRPDRPAPLAVREPTSITTRRAPVESAATGVEVEAQRVRDSGVQRRAVRPTMSDIPGLGRLTPMQRAIVYGEIFGRPVALGGGIDDSPD